MDEYLNANEAVGRAFMTIRELIPEDQLPNLALEEVEFDDKNEEWRITVGYDSPRVIKKTSPASSLFGTTTEETERNYKILRIDGHTGDFISMKIRKL